MEVRTYRARTLQEALQAVRQELGPDAAILQTREVSRGWLRRCVSGRLVEVAASSTVQVPRRFADEPQRQPVEEHVAHGVDLLELPPAEADIRFRTTVEGQLNKLTDLVEGLRERPGDSANPQLPDALFEAFTNLIEADIEESTARSLLDAVRQEPERNNGNPLLVRAQLLSLVEDRLRVSGPIQTKPQQCRVVALVGPTGVGKTTTIAKLAAHYRLKERKRVGLITVDTYRIAAVEQLRTYADIIDLPMEVVASPREMREAVERMAHLDLVLMDTAGRSPRDEIRIAELRTMLNEASVDETHLVLSATSSASQMSQAAARFETVGTTSLLLTKLDEATALGHLLTLFEQCDLPVSYLTDGQDVPDDITVAEPGPLAKTVLAM